MVETPLWLLITLVQFGILMLLAAVILWRKYHKSRQYSAQMRARLQQISGQSTSHKLRIAELEVQLESINSFEELYFELAQEHKKLQSLQEEFQHKAGALLSESDQATLKQTLDELQTQKQQLENKLKSVQDALEDILAKQVDMQDIDLSGRDVLQTSARVEEEIRAIRDVISHQKALITHLHDQVNILQIEVGEKHELETLLHKLEAQNATMGVTLTGMQTENDRLKGQVRAIQVQERAQHNDNAQEVEQLRAVLVEKEQAYAELEKKFTTIETEYQRIYAKSQKLQA